MVSMPGCANQPNHASSAGEPTISLGIHIRSMTKRKGALRNPTLRRTRVADRDGAGIRAEGGDQTVEDSRFLNNENGILSAENPAMTIRIDDSSFVGNGRCQGSFSHGIHIGCAKLPRVHQSTFFDTRDRLYIKSRALRTDALDSDIAGGPEGSSGYLIETANAGGLIVERDKMEKRKLEHDRFRLKRSCSKRFD
jgi:hypothetical protein